MPRFFLSYARADDELRADGPVQQFFEDLSAQVAGSVSDDPETVGYIDQHNLEPGDAWPEELARAIGTSRTFVPVMTARYFTRAFCGREWTLFEQRCESAKHSFGRVPPVIIPMIWVPPLDGDFPDFARDLHTEPPSGTGSYGRKGLLAAVKRRDSEKSTYESILEYFAELIIRRGNEFPLPDLPADSMPRLDAISPRFPVLPPDGPDSTPGVAVAHFAFAAAAQQEGRSIRPHAQEYYRGADGGYWYPYAPELKKPIALVAQNQASERNLVIERLPIDANLLNRLRRAEADNQPVIVIVDPWSAANLVRLSSALEQFDEYQYLNCAVLIAWDLTDTTALQRAELEARMQQIFRRRFKTSHPVLFRNGIVDSAALTREIGAALRDLDLLLAPQKANLRPIGDNAETVPLRPTLSTVSNP